MIERNSGDWLKRHSRAPEREKRNVAKRRARIDDLNNSLCFLLVDLSNWKSTSGANRQEKLHVVGHSVTVFAPLDIKHALLTAATNDSSASKPPFFLGRDGDSFPRVMAVYEPHDMKCGTRLLALLDGGCWAHDSVVNCQFLHGLYVAEIFMAGSRDSRNSGSVFSLIEQRVKANVEA